jgi:ATP-binding cassette subfamily B (MDR/TAP) protein 1
MPTRNYKETAAFQIENDSSASHSLNEPSSPKMKKSPSLQRISNVSHSRPSDVIYKFQDSPEVPSPSSEKVLENGQAPGADDKEPSIRRQDSFEMRLPELPKIDIQSVPRQKSNGSDPESPISPFLTSDPKKERSHSQSFSRPHSHSDDASVTMREERGARKRKPPSLQKLIELSFAEWLYALLGSIGAAAFGSFNPLLAYVVGLVVAAYYRIDDQHHLAQEVDKWCLIIGCMGIVTVIANFLQHFYFGIMGEKMTERIRRMMFSGA